MNIRVRGGQVLHGTVTPSGSKNSAVAIIPATILFDRPVTLTNIPDITDVQRLVAILERLGSKVIWDKNSNTLTLDNKNLAADNLGFAEFGSMRGSVLLWGPLLGRFRKIRFNDLPGGCSLGMRPLDTHYLALQDLGVTIKESTTFIELDGTRVSSTEMMLHEMSPTATENAVMLAAVLPGKTTIRRAASEPQVQDLCLFLKAAGAKISGIGTNVLEIDGGHSLKPVTHRLFPDHNEIATYLALGAITGGTIEVQDAPPELLLPVTRQFSKLGVEVVWQSDKVIVRRNQSIAIAKGANDQTLVIKAEPWPGFPVDILPLLIPIALAAPKGNVLFHNYMYESGLFWTEELRKMGANVTIADPHRVLVTAGNKLVGATLEAPYIIRAVVALVMTAMIAKGETVILNADALYRGHPNFSANLRTLGADIEEI